MTESAIADWQKGGLRYAKLMKIVPEFLAPEQVRAFFVGVKGGGRFRLINPFSPLQREYVIAATTDYLVVLRLRRPVVFRASIADVAYRVKSKEADLQWENGELTVGDVSYQPISFHGQDAEEVARLSMALGCFVLRLCRRN
jgi:hypothetical protein